MHRGSRHNGSGRKALRIFQANVGKISAAHDTALALADSERYDIVLLQEPWTGLTETRCLTKTHPAYDTFSPVNDWDSRDTRPRVMTYVRRSAGLVADQKRPAATRDILWLTVNGATVVNFYRQPGCDMALEILLQWTPTEKCLVAGDFNAKHPSWQAGRQLDRGEDIAFWAVDNRLSLLNAVDVPTNAHGSTIDLAFSDIPLADAVVEDHLATGSDHFTLSITLPSQPLAPLPISRIRLNSDEQLKRFVELVEAGAAFIPTSTASPLELDDFESALVSLLGCAARAAGRPVPKREFHNVVRRAKRLYWRGLIDNFADSDAIFRAVRWLKSPGPFQVPPLQVDGRVYETQLEKATVLRRATLERRTASDDIPDPWVPVNANKTIPFTDQLSFEEVCDATLRTGNTSPGADNITVRMLRAAWHAIGSLVHQLYQGCLNIGYHPKPFREAEGAFDTVLCNRLVLRSREQGWPPNLARWVGSFMQDRSARVRYQDTVTDSSLLQCGLPQGSPVSPILFLLYTEPIYRLGNSQGRFGYADDTAILSVGDSLDDTSAETSHHVRELLSWGAANRVFFDPDKTEEVMHFSRKKPKVAPPVLHGQVEKRPDEAMRWLGIWLDSTLTFKIHVDKWTAKAQAVAECCAACRLRLRHPSATLRSRGVVPWSDLPALDQADQRGPVGDQSRQKMSKALDTSLRAILPVWRTTPTSALYREAGIPPVPLLFEARRMAFAARLKALDEAHLLVKRTSRPKIPVATANKLIKLEHRKSPQPFRTRLRRTDEMLPSCPRPALLQRGFSEAQNAPLQSASKTETAKEFRSWLQALSPRSLVVYSDGSRSDGAGKGHLGPAEVFDAEAKGALEGLKAAASLPDADRVPVCLDNIAPAKCLRGTPSDSSQDVFIEFQNLARHHGAVEVHRIPGHAGIPGNEEADALAKARASLPEPADSASTLAHLRKIARQRRKEAFKTWRRASAPDQYKTLDLTTTTGCPSELALSRPLLHHLLAARTRHGDFADYHERFDHQDARLTCSCGRRKDPTHIFYCRKVAPRHRLRLTPSPTRAISRAIGKDFDSFVKLAKASSFFGGICPHH
ncbi:hypothetical protein HIM_10938 [Hirsutella minnesotensis 3608]|uniref:RNase H type-1 domain-containing protein n=1 Tax=Hirsutella minnesotensis 3608 TaxID=1043627 RepID=A0A0F7ZJI6_9HYPO|nr:hypothetical protein HIM_10938 [Hirsutella minnesotensis 3608]